MVRAAEVVHVVSARPNFMKVAPIYHALARRGNVDQLVVHTGQHYDADMSDVFLSDLAMPPPDVRLSVGSGSHGEQTAWTILRLERVLLDRPKALLSVVGDTNGAVSATLVAAKLGMPVAHVEAGLRSFDRRMPEEVNRVVIDQLADLLLTPSQDAEENLRRENIPARRIHPVGNVMIDTLLGSLDRARSLPVPTELGLAEGAYAVCTLHRPSNVDDPARLAALARALTALSRELPVVFPVHPRTRRQLGRPPVAEALASAPGIRLLPPMGYLRFLSLTSRARLILTDSGGLQEEATVLGVPCVTLRENTERPVTLHEGTNTLAGTDPTSISRAIDKALRAPSGPGAAPELWDGAAAERVADVYERHLVVSGAAPVAAG
jgi:UDP-N-acetylglucosamine 2-epimerase (non-hydrolysing)